MKKTLLFALAGIMLLAFTQCGNNDKKTTGSKQYQDLKKGHEEIAKIIEDASDCDELQSALFGLLALYLQDQEYKEDEQMTADEESEIAKLSDEISKLYDEKAEEFGGCKDESDDLWDDDDDEDWSWDDDDDDWSWGESQEFKDVKQAINEMTYAVEFGTDCDDIENELDRIVEKFSKDYDEEDQMTEEEQEQIEDLYEEFSKLIIKKGTELGCE